MRFEKRIGQILKSKTSISLSLYTEPVAFTILNQTSWQHFPIVLKLGIFIFIKLYMTLNKHIKKHLKIRRNRLCIWAPKRTINRNPFGYLFSQRFHNFPLEGKSKRIPSNTQLNAVLRPSDFLFHCCCACNNATQWGRRYMH